MNKVPLNHLLKIGADALQTTAQTLSGAINELKAAISSIVDSPEVEYHKYNDDIETITKDAYGSWQFVTFHNVHFSDSTGARTYYKIVCDIGSTKVWKRTPVSSSNINGGLRDISYKVLVDTNNTHFRLIKYMPK